VPRFAPCREIPNGLSIQSLRYTGNWNFAMAMSRDGDAIYLFDNTTQSYRSPYQFINSYGWFSSSPDDPGAAGPRIPSGTAFWISGRPGCRCLWWCQNFAECRCDTNTALSPHGLWLLNPSRTNTVFRFEFASELATRYEVQRTEDLWDPWESVRIVSGDGLIMQVEDRNAVAANYYRLLKLP